MRTLIRLGVLVLAALGAKGLWEKYGPRLQRAKSAGADLSGRVKSSAVEVGTKVGGVAQRIGGTTYAGDGDSKYSALEKAEEVSAAADAARDHAAHAPPASDPSLVGDHQLEHNVINPRC
jgi:hypothetical protein